MRIIAGSARGTRLKNLRGMSTRPTADRIRESLFSVLSSREMIRGRRVLDIFSGTGALALEALSRGADSAAAIDKSTGRLIRENGEITRLSERLEVINGDVLAALERLIIKGRRFDLVFSDPPYRKGLTEKALALLAKGGLLSDGGVICAEVAEEEEILPPEGLEVIRQLSYGRTTKILLLERAAVRKEGS